MKPIVGIIPARGGSKGLPGKNIKLLAGKPLIAWTIETALQSGMLQRLLVSTDDPAIVAIARQFGAEVPFLRPEALSRDETGAVEVALHALDWLEQNQSLPSTLLWLQPTSPFRSCDDIVRGAAVMSQTRAPAVLGVCETKAHPLQILKIGPRGHLEPYFADSQHELRRQDLPRAYQVNGAFYLIRTDAIRRYRSFIPPGAMPYLMPHERSLDIDTAWDFFLAESTLQSQAPPACGIPVGTVSSGKKNGASIPPSK